MLVGISPLLSPELLATLCRMGHGDEVVLADAHFPGETMGRRCLRADGLQVADLLDGILPLFCLDAYVQAPLSMMAAVDGDQHDPGVESAYRSAVDRYAADCSSRTLCVLRTSERSLCRGYDRGHRKIRQPDSDQGCHARALRVRQSQV